MRRQLKTKDLHTDCTCREILGRRNRYALAVQRNRETSGGMRSARPVFGSGSNRAFPFYNDLSGAEFRWPLAADETPLLPLACTAEAVCGTSQPEFLKTNSRLWMFPGYVLRRRNVLFFPCAVRRHGARKDGRNRSWDCFRDVFPVSSAGVRTRREHAPAEPVIISTRPSCFCHRSNHHIIKGAEPDIGFCVSVVASRPLRTRFFTLPPAGGPFFPCEILRNPTNSQVRPRMLRPVLRCRTERPYSGGTPMIVRGAKAWIVTPKAVRKSVLWRRSVPLFSAHSGERNAGGRAGRRRRIGAPRFTKPEKVNMRNCEASRFVPTSSGAR